MSQAKREAAREFNIQKQYVLARTILSTLPEDEVAQRWLKKLDEIAPLPKTLENTPIEELIQLLYRRDVAYEVMKRIFKMIEDNRYLYEIRSQAKSRQELSLVTNQLCQALENSHGNKSVQNIISFVIQYLTYYEECKLPGPPEMETLGKMLNRGIDVADEAERTLQIIDTLPARLLLFAHRQKDSRHYTIRWNQVNKRSFSQNQVPAVELYQNDKLRLSIFIKKEGKEYFVIFPDDLWKEHMDTASLIVETTYAVLQSLLEEAAYIDMMQMPDDASEAVNDFDILDTNFGGDIDAHNRWMND